VSSDSYDEKVECRSCGQPVSPIVLDAIWQERQSIAAAERRRWAREAPGDDSLDFLWDDDVAEEDDG
jgi:hypothetical protein